jgi:hypothetical protein
VDAQTIYPLLTSEFPYIDLSITDEDRVLILRYIELVLWKWELVLKLQRLQGWRWRYLRRQLGVKLGERNEGIERGI